MDRWDSELVLLEQDRDQKSGNEYNHAIGTRYTVKDLVERMLEDSDNTAFNIFLRNMENSDIEDLISVLGLEDLFSDEGKITAKEYSRIFRALYVANYLDEDNSQLLLYFLGQASFKDFLSKGIPETVIFAHKYGENIEKNVYLDSGIIYIPDRPVLITVAIEGKEDTTASKSKAQELMQKISQLTYNYVSQK
jgi:beta-lactamase class A